MPLRCQNLTSLVCLKKPSLARDERVEQPRRHKLTDFNLSQDDIQQSKYVFDEIQLTKYMFRVLFWGRVWLDRGRQWHHFPSRTCSENCCFCCPNSLKCCFFRPYPAPYPALIGPYGPIGPISGPYRPHRPRIRPLSAPLKGKIWK